MKVGRKYRTNPASKTPGGVTVVVEFKNSRHNEYPDVKNPNAFIDAIWRNDKDDMIKAAYVKGVPEPDPVTSKSAIDRMRHVQDKRMFLILLDGTVLFERYYMSSWSYVHKAGGKTVREAVAPFEHRFLGLFLTDIAAQLDGGADRHGLKINAPAVVSETVRVGDKLITVLKKNKGEGNENNQRA